MKMPKIPSTKWFYLITSGLSVVAIVMGCVFMLNGANHQTERKQQQVHLKQQQTQRKLSKFEQERPLYSRTEERLDTFMSAYFNYDDQKAYNHRRQAAKKVVSPAVYDNRRLFKEDKYSKTRQLGLQSTFVKNQIVPTKITDQQLEATVYTTQELNFEDEEGQDTIKVFQVTYDGKTDKLVKIDQQGFYNIAVDSTETVD